MHAVVSRPVPRDLIGCCFNCFADDPVAASYRNPTRCFRCKEVGHTLDLCKKATSPTSPPITDLRDVLLSRPMVVANSAIRRSPSAASGSSGRSPSPQRRRTASQAPSLTLAVTETDRSPRPPTAFQRCRRRVPPRESLPLPLQRNLRRSSVSGNARHGEVLVLRYG